MNVPPIQYFFPKYGRTSPPAELADVFKDRPLSRSQASADGPAKLKGTIFSYFDDVFCLYQETQMRAAKFLTYLEDGSELEYYIITKNDASAEDFIREKTLPGSRVEMEHGEWIIPVANPLVDSCVVPFFEMSEDGGDSWYKEYKEEYLEATQGALEMAGHVRAMALAKEAGEASIELDERELRQLICTMIGVNYRLSFNEMVALRLFDTEKYMDLVNAFVDAKATFELMASGGWEEANAENPFPDPPDGSDIASGDEDF